MATEKPNVSIADEWLEEDNLELLECWARDGYTLQDIANRIGISLSALTVWRNKYPEIRDALRKGKEIIDYKVENALLKSALGYRTKEVKVTTTMRKGVVTETIKEVTSKDQAPSVQACQVWLYNRCKDKWRKNNDNLIELEEDTTIEINVVRQPTRVAADTVEKVQPAQQNDEVDEEWQDEVNTSIAISKRKDQEEDEAVEPTSKTVTQSSRKVSAKDAEDLDYWPDDWEDE